MQHLSVQCVPTMIVMIQKKKWLDDNVFFGEKGGGGVLSAQITYTVISPLFVVLDPGDSRKTNDFFFLAYRFMEDIDKVYSIKCNGSPFYRRTFSR